MSDISVQINPPASIPVTIGQGVTPHAATHAPDASDSLAAFYVTGNVVRPSETGQFLTSGQTGSFITSSQTGIFLTSGQTGTLTGDFYPLKSNPSGYVQGAVVRPSNTGGFLDIGSNQTISALKNFTVRPTVSGIGVLLSGESAVNTGTLTGAFYPLNANPSGYITGVDLSNYVTKSSTGIFVTTGETGVFITSTQTGVFVTTGSTGSFIVSSQTGQFVSTGSTGAFVTGSVVRPSETGVFVTTSQTGNFITVSQTGQFVSTGSTGNFTTGAVVRPSETGIFVTTGQTGNFVTASQTGIFATESALNVVSGTSNSGYNSSITGIQISGDSTKTIFLYPRSGQAISGSFVDNGGAGGNTGELTGVFYPLNSNPSGYITGVDLSSYATTGYVTGVSGHLQGQITSLNNQTGSYVTGDVVRPSETGNFITTSQTGQFVGDSETGAFLTTGAADARYVNLTGNQTVSGTKTFNSSIVLPSGAIVTGSGSISFDTSAGFTSAAAGEINWNSDDQTFNLGLNGEVTLQVGLEQLVKVKAGADIRNGMTVYAAGQVGASANIEVLPFIASADGPNEIYFLGIATQEILNGNEGFATTFGKVRNVNGSTYSAGGVRDDADGSWSVGNILYASPHISGTFTTGAPVSPEKTMEIAMVLTAPNESNITLFVRADHGYRLSDLHDVNIESLQDSNILKWNAASGRWENSNSINLSGISVSGNAVVTGSVVRPSETGSFITTSQTGQFVSTGATGSFLTAASQFVQEIYIDAAAMLTGISGAVPTGITVSDSGVSYDCYSFDSATTGFTQFKFALDDYDLGAMKAKFHWTAPGSVTGGVVWGIQSIGVGDGEFLNSGFAGGSEVADIFSTGTGLFTSNAVAFTPSGTLATGDLFLFRIYRSVANANDDLGVSAYLLGVSIQYTGNRINAW